MSNALEKSDTVVLGICYKNRKADSAVIADSKELRHITKSYFRIKNNILFPKVWSQFKLVTRVELASGKWPPHIKQITI